VAVIGILLGCLVTAGRVLAAFCRQLYKSRKFCSSIVSKLFAPSKGADLNINVLRYNSPVSKVYLECYDECVIFSLLMFLERKTYSNIYASAEYT